MEPPKVKASKRNIKTCNHDPTMSPQLVQLQQEKDDMQQEILELKTKILLLENEKHLFRLENPELVMKNKVVSPS